MMLDNFKWYCDAGICQNVYLNMLSVTSQGEVKQSFRLLSTPAEMLIRLQALTLGTQNFTKINIFVNK